VTWLNYMSDQFAGLHAIVVPGTLRDSLMILDGLLELQPPGDGGPTMIITDQASYFRPDLRPVLAPRKLSQNCLALRGVGSG
jgi:hypothetical protein